MYHSTHHTPANNGRICKSAIFTVRFCNNAKFFFSGLIRLDSYILKIDVAKHIFQSIQSLLPHFRFQLTLPDGNAMPPHRSQLLPFLYIPTTITLNLILPKLDICLGNDIIFASFVPVPKASRQIYNLISANPHITTTQMAEKLKLSQRQIQKYLKRLQEAEKIFRSGSRKNSEWKIIDEEYEGFFDRI